MKRNTCDTYGIEDNWPHGVSVATWLFCSFFSGPAHLWIVSNGGVVQTEYTQYISSKKKSG